MDKKDKILKIFTSEVKKEFNGNLKKIILFGSRARGEAAPDSDYDILVVLDEISQKTKDSLNQIEGNLLYHYNKVFSAFPFTPKDLSSRKYEPFIINAQKEGIEL